MLPPDTEIPVASKKRPATAEPTTAPPAKKAAKWPSTKSSMKPAQAPTKATSSSANIKVVSSIAAKLPTKPTFQKVDAIAAADDQESEPEESLAPTAPTVHYDPNMGKLVGWRIRVWDTKAWRDGRILLYDTFTNKHKVQMKDKLPGLDQAQCVWLRLIHEVSNRVSSSACGGVCNCTKNHLNCMSIYIVDSSIRGTPCLGPR